MRFQYKARTEQGGLQAGFVDSGNRDAALDILRSHDLFVLSIEEVGGVPWYVKIVSFLNKVQIRDLMLFTRQFAILLESKVPLSESLRTLENQMRNPVLKEAIREIYDGVSAGLALSQAMERRSDIFSEFYINMIRPAEVTGRLEQAMTFLADYLEKESMWVARIRNALIYPAIVVVLFIVVAAVMLVVVFPQLQPVFAEAHITLPLITIIFLGAGNFILRWWLAIILVAVLFIILIVDYLRSNEGKIVADELKVRIPILGELFKKIYVARFAESVSILIKGGIPLIQAVEISGNSIQNSVYGEVLHEVAEGIKRGDLLSALLSADDKHFPPLVGQMVAIGEGSGRIEEVLAKVSSLYTREVNDLLSNLIELIQPALIVAIGGMVGLLFASILIPIYNLARSF